MELEEGDIVVLGISIGAIPYVARQLISNSARWRSMVANVKAVPTEALQLWLRPSTPALRWESDAIVGGYGKPFDTWSDMPESLAAEGWGPDGPQSLAYFCSVFDPHEIALDPPPETDDSGLRQHYDRVWDEATKQLRLDVDEFVRDRLPLLWTGTRTALKGGRRELDIELQRYERVNIDPSDRYVLSLPGSSRYRLPPDDTDFSNVYVVGDWVATPVNAGCVEAAVMSGMIAARAIGCTEDIEIIGERSRRQ